MGNGWDSNEFVEFWARMRLRCGRCIAVIASTVAVAGGVCCMAEIDRASRLDHDNVWLRWEAQDYTEVTSAAMATTALLPWRRVGVGLDGTLHDD